jgi:3-hydroxyacyl-CoA dehydrogenase
MVNEATRILEERVALRAPISISSRSTATASRAGEAGRYAEARGLSEIVAILALLSTDGLAKPPCEDLRKAAQAADFSVLASE